MRWSLKTTLAAVALALTGAVVSTCSAHTREPPHLTDYLVQDVCLDSRGSVTSNDPATCPNHRNLKAGEAVPYLLTDYDRTTGNSFQATSSLPVRGADGKPMVLIFKSLEGPFRADYRFNFSPARDAFDLIDVSNSAYASIVRTFDGGCLDQVFSHDGRRATLADRSGAWILFPLRPAPSEWPRSQSVKNKTYRMQLVDHGAACVDNHASGLTTWHRPSTTQFESGRSLLAIRSDHFAGENLSQPENSFERTYFTQEYGLTRWEAWQTLTYCQKSRGATIVACRPNDPANPLHARCTALKEPTTGKAGEANIGGQPWVRIMCRDQTHFIRLTRAQVFLASNVASGNGVRDVDYPATFHATRK